MKSYIIKRGNKYNFVRRIPSDLLGYFPNKVLYRSLKTGDMKEARLLAASYEYNVEKTFMRLRTGMLGMFEAKILVERLIKRVPYIEAIAYGTQDSVSAFLDRNIAQRLIEERGCSEREAKGLLAQGCSEIAEFHRDCIIDHDTEYNMHAVDDVDKQLRSEYKIMLNDAEKRQLSMKFLHQDKELFAAEADVRLGNQEKLQALQEKIARDTVAANKKYFLKTIIKDYESTYDKKSITLNSWRAVSRHLKLIAKTLGNIEFTELNSKAAVEKLRLALNKRKKSNGDALSAKEYGGYCKRLKSLVTFAIEKYEIDTTNKIVVKTEKGGERSSFDFKDMKRLEDALCTAPMIFGKSGETRNDRFWILLIAVLHGFRKTSIVELRGRHLRIDEQTGLLCFDLTDDAKVLQTKNDSMRSLVPIHPHLIDLGFTKWLDKMQFPADGKLFVDTSNNFGQWFNGLTPTSGWNYDYITQDDKKTFHSFRHYFCCCMDELDIAENHKNEMSGHAGVSRGKGVRSKHYTDRTRVKSMADTFLKSIESGRILQADIDWKRLQDRAKELFFSM